MRRRDTTGPNWVAMGGLVAVVALLAGLLGGGAAALWRSGPPTSQLASGPHSVISADGPAPSIVPSDPARTCSIEAAASDPAALAFHGVVVDDQTNEVLFERDATGAVPTASTMKLITAVTAISVLGPESRFPTRVVPGDQPGSVVLVGGGDPTLKSGAASYYTIATASIGDLAAAVQAAGGAGAVGIDGTAFGGPQWQPSWDDIDRTDGYIAPISALMVDAGRTNPTALYSPRTTTPDRDAGQALATALGARLDPAIRPADGAAPIAEVWSPTVRELVDVVLLDSDNVLAEALARLVAIHLGAGTDFASIDGAQRQALSDLGLDATGLVADDGSGLSPDDRTTPALMVDLLHLIETRPDLAGLREMLPKNQLSGTLDTRIPGLAPGTIEAKTGYITDVYGLAGWAKLDGGVEVRFALYVARPEGAPDVTPTNRDALDAIATALTHCGLTLSNR